MSEYNVIENEITQQLEIQALFERLEIEDVKTLFSLICDIQGIKEQQKVRVSQLFEGLYCSLSWLFNNNEIAKIDFKSIEEYSELYSLIKILKNRRDLPSPYAENIFKTLHGIAEYQHMAPRQTDYVHDQYNSLRKSMLSLLERVSLKSLYDITQAKDILQKLNLKVDSKEEEKLIINFFKKSLNKDNFKIAKEIELINTIRSEVSVDDNPIDPNSFNTLSELLNINYFIKQLTATQFIDVVNLLKKSDDKFTLKKYDNENLLNDYLQTINTSTLLNSDLLDLFKNEGYSLELVDIEKLESVYSVISTKVNAEKYFIEILKRLIPLLSEDAKAFLSKKNEDFDIKSLALQKLETDLNWYSLDSLLKSLGNEGKKNNLLKNIRDNYPAKKPILKIEDESFFDILEQEIPNFKEVIDFYKGQFRQNYYSNKRHVAPILLLGDPGIGKTYFAKRLAKYLKTGYTFIDMGSISAGWVLTGNNGTWQDAKQGKILEAMMNSPTVNPIVLMDEIDKVSSGKYDPLAPLHQLLEEVNSTEIVDEFADLTFDGSGIIYIACANTINTLSDPLLSRFKIFEVPSPNSNQLDSIIQNIYNLAIENNPLLSLTLSPEIINYLKSNSLRESKVMIQDAINNVMLSMSRQELKLLNESNNKISLDLNYFKDKKTKTKIGF